jgi:hypothetical protein
MSNEDNKNTKLDFFEEFPLDFLEAFITILIVRAIMDKPIDFVYVTKTSLVLSLLVYMASLISNDYKSHIKEGLRNSIGYFIFTQFSV